MHRFLEWLDLHDVESQRAARNIPSWLALWPVVMVLLAAAAWVPGLRSFFQLQVVFPAALFQVLFLVAVAAATVEGGRQLPHRPLAAFLALFALLMELFVVSLVTCSSMPGAAVFAGLALFTATWHGHLFRVSPRYPWHALGSVVVFAMAAALNPTPEHLAIFAILAPTAIVGKLLLGTWALKSDQHRAEAQRLREAVQAQMLDDQSTKLAELADMLLDLVARNHDVRNAVMAAHVGAETLQTLSTEDDLEQKRDTLHAIAENVESSLGRVQALLTDITVLGRERLAEVAPDRVRVRPVLAQLIEGVERRFPSVRIDAEPIDDAMAVRVAGGEVTLRRILENALVNACEGNGAAHAAHVRVRVEASERHPYVRVIVHDDGPGFDLGLVERPIQGFATTKEHGTGLGLYTMERLSRASGGRISRSNEGGALLTIELLRAEGEAAAA